MRKTVFLLISLVLTFAIAISPASAVTSNSPDSLLDTLINGKRKTGETVP